MIFSNVVFPAPLGPCDEHEFPLLNRQTHVYERWLFRAKSFVHMKELDHLTQPEGLLSEKQGPKRTRIAIHVLGR